MSSSTAIDEVIDALSPILATQHVDVQALVALLPYLLKLVAQFYIYNDAQRIQIIEEGFVHVLSGYSGDNQVQLMDFVQTALPAMLRLLLSQSSVVYKYFQVLLVRCKCQRPEQHKLAIRRILRSQ